MKSQCTLRRSLFFRYYFRMKRGYERLALVVLLLLVATPAVSTEPVGPDAHALQIAEIEVSSPRLIIDVGESVQLSVIGTTEGGSTIDVTSPLEGTQYFALNSNVLSINVDGLVTGVGGGNSEILVQHPEQASSSIKISVVSENDGDADFVPDDYEIANGMDSADPLDAILDFDNDGLTNLMEFELGTDPNVADSDGDTVADGHEIELGTNPLQPFRLDDTCTVSLLNRTTRVRADGTFALSNAPTASALVRARAVCARDGLVLEGASEFFQLNANDFTQIPPISLGESAPSVQRLEIEATEMVLDSEGAESQLTVTALRSDGTEVDVSTFTLGTMYIVSNSAVATVDSQGLVVAGSTSGTVLISVLNDGVFASKMISVALSDDNDSDGLPNDYEDLFGLDKNNSADATFDQDGDGLTALDEFNMGTLPNNFDTDGDGLSDGQEVALGSSPFSPDSDLDGVLDGSEPSPTADFDGDGITNILDSDSDNDGLTDGVEVAIVGNTTGASPFEDNDGDGLTNADEVALSTDPTNSDTDGDGLTDGEEVLASNDPLVPETVPPTVMIASPQPGTEVVEGQTLSIVVDATDNAVVDEVAVSVNSVPFLADGTEPYEVTFTVPFGTQTLELNATATDRAGNQGSDDATFGIESELGTIVVGSVVDPDGNPAPNASVSIEVNGLLAEFFDFDTPLSSLPDLDNLVPDSTKVVSAINFLNPGNIFSPDTFGEALGPDFAARFSGLIRAPVPGQYAIRLRADDGARLTIDGILVTEVVDGGEIAESQGTVTLSTSPVPIQIDYFQATGDAELQIAIVEPNETDEVVLPPSTIMPTPDPFVATTDANGDFTIADVQTNLGDLVADVTTTLPDGTPVFGASGSFPPVRGGTTNVGQIDLIPGFPNGNGGFESGDFTGYTVSGDTAVVTQLGSVLPPEGQFMAFLSTSDLAVNSITSTITTESFRIPSGVNFLTFDFNFLTDEVTPDTFFNDTLLVRLNTSAGAVETIVADTTFPNFVSGVDTGFFEMTGFNTIQLDVSGLAGMPEPCTLSFEIQIFDVGDTVVDSAALIDNLRFEQ